MQDREHTQIELDKLNTCRNYLQQNGIFDKESFVDFLRRIDYERENTKIS